MLDHTTAVAVTLGLDAHAMEHGQPDVAKGRVLGGHDMFTQLEIGTATGEEGRTVVEVVEV